MAREQDLGRIFTETLAIPPGATATFLPVPGQYAVAIQYISGGSLSLGGPSVSIGTSFINGSSFQLGGFGATTGGIFTFANTNVMMLNDFIGSFNLLATGATSVCSIIRAFTPGALGLSSNYIP